uniref:GYF domain-containing protein n=1 Tax=Trichuris muris TaxID=70415 RepID=A0A5S6QH46_TRIMR
MVILCANTNMKDSLLAKRKAASEIELDEDVPSDQALLSISRERQCRSADLDSAGRSVAGSTSQPNNGTNDEEGEAPKKQHTLDSDEEEEQKYRVLDLNTVVGQEEKTIDFDEETKITPFNMAEELDEGHFDSEGTFIFRSSKDEIKDAWLENIDWAKIKKDAGSLWEKEAKEESDDLLDCLTPSNRLFLYESISKLMLPKETVAKTIQRLGGSKQSVESRRHRWKGKTGTAAAEEEENKRCAENVMNFTEMVDKLLADGELDIYSYTFEKFAFEISRLKENNPTSAGCSGGNDDAQLDMFAEEIDEADLKGPKRETDDAPLPAAEKAESDDQVTWQFKWEEAEDAPVYGPFSSSQMKDWSDNGYFEKGIFVRRSNQLEGPFYSSKRIDFEVYI